MKNDYLAWLEYHIAAALAKSAADVGSKLAADSNYVAVATSGPPQMAHETGRIISAKFGIPLVLDFRDPWSLQEYVVGQMASPVWFRLAERYERAAIRQSSVVALNTDPLRDAMLAKYPELRDRAITVRNGCDNERLPKVDKGSRFTIRFAGEIYIDRDPRLVFRAAGRVVRDLALTPREFGFQLIGLVEMFQGVPLTEIARQEGLGGFVETGPYRPRAEALEFLAGASMLLSLPQDARMSIPAKIYEYIQFDAWLLVLARSESPTAALLRGTDADIIAPDDVDRMSEVIRRRYEQFARGERAQPVAASGQFDRVHQARILLDRIAQVAKTAK
jgi:glycosyltransferase involved in cell wall biosynthesis